METIIQNLDDNMLKEYPSVLLRVNSKLKKMGFKHAFINNETIELNTYQEDLSIYFGTTGIRDISRSIIYLNEEEGEKLKELLSSKEGFYNFDHYYKLDYLDDGDQRIQININDELIEIGRYLKKRNIVLIYLPMAYNLNRVVIKNECLLFVLKEIEGWIENNKIEKVDISESIKDELKERFLNQTKENISLFQRKITENKEDIKRFTRTLISSYSNIKQNKITLESLNRSLKEMAGSIDVYMTDIKKLNFVSKCSISGRGIRVDFKDIYIKVDGNDIFMGRYYCYILPNDIKIINKDAITHDGRTYHSPHIEDNHICFGEEKSKFYEILGSGNLKKAVHFIYLYLKSYNSNDTYVSMIDWIKYRETGSTENDEEDEYNNDNDHDEEDN